MEGLGRSIFRLAIHRLSYATVQKTLLRGWGRGEYYSQSRNRLD